jgi:hypothetical protein
MRKIIANYYYIISSIINYKNIIYEYKLDIKLIRFIIYNQNRVQNK